MKRAVDIGALHAALDSKREAEGLSWRDVGKITGINHATFTRLSQGRRCDVDSFVTLTGWLGLAAERFVSGTDPSSPDEETVAVVTRYLRADPALQPAARRALDVLYRSMRDA